VRQRLSRFCPTPYLPARLLLEGKARPHRHSVPSCPGVVVGADASDQRFAAGGGRLRASHPPLSARNRFWRGATSGRVRKASRMVLYAEGTAPLTYRAAGAARPKTGRVVRSIRSAQGERHPCCEARDPGRIWSCRGRHAGRLGQTAARARIGSASAADCISRSIHLPTPKRPLGSATPVSSSLPQVVACALSVMQ